MFRSTLDREYRHALDLAAETKRQAIEIRDASAAGSISFNVVENYHRFLGNALAEWGRVKTIPGIAAYAQAQTGDATYDVATEFGAMEAEAAATRDWIEANVPQHGQGWWLVYRWDAQNGVETRSFTPAETAGLRTQLDALIATIE